MRDSSSINTEEKDLKKFFHGDLGFPTNEDSTLFDFLVNKYQGTKIVVYSGNYKVNGTLHSATMIWGNHLNLTSVNEEDCTPGILEQFHYYHPRNYKPELEERNFGFVSAAFAEDPQKTDLLVIPVDGCRIQFHDGYELTIKEAEDYDEEE